MKKIVIGIAMSWFAHALMAQTPELSDSIQEVVVTGTGTQHLLKNAPVQTEVISKRMLQQYGGSSLQDILSGLTASFAFNEGDMGSQMQLNGLGNSYILILVDGKRLHGDNGGENELSLIDPQNIEKIEIVKGASSALYGSDAIAGVINVITRKHHDEALNLELTQRLGSHGEQRRHAGLAFSLGAFSSYTHYQSYDSDGWQNTATEDPRQTEFLITDSRNMTVNANSHWQLSQRFTYTPFKQLELYGEASTYWKRIYRPKGKYPGVDVKTYDLAYRNQSASVGGKWLHGLTGSKTDAITLDVDWNRHAYYYEYTAFTLTEGYDPYGQLTPYYPYFDGDEEVQSDQRRTMAHLKGVFTLPGDNRLSAGAEWRYDLLKAPMRVVNGRVEDHTEALYVQDEWQTVCNDAIATNLTAGLRLTNNGKFGRRLTPKVSGMLSIGDHWRLRATWSQGFKTPTPKELHYRYLRNMGGLILCIGNTSLKPQTSNYYALSGEWDWNGLNITVTGYLNDVDNMITLVTIPTWQAPAYYIEMYDPQKTRQYKNLETAKTRGVDFSMRYRINREWSAGLSYSYLDTDAEQYDTETEQLQKVVIDGTAHHKGSCFATWNHAFTKAYKLGVGLYGRMSSTRYYQINGNGKGYQLWRFSTTHELGSKFLCRIEAGVDNIFNYVDRTPHGLHLGTTTAGRTVYASLTLRLNQGKKLNILSNTKSNFNSKNNEED
jgi:outer membrane receptor for ferrienterochelin and colicins